MPLPVGQGLRPVSTACNTFKTTLNASFSLPELVPIPIEGRLSGSTHTPLPLPRLLSDFDKLPPLLI